MLYLEHTPAPPLDSFIRALWYAQSRQHSHRERILPTGCVQIILNLDRDFLLDCPVGRPDRRMAPSLVVGARSIFEIVDTSDMADLIGIMFQPGGFPPFAADAADLFSNRSVGLEEIWGTSAGDLRDHLRALPTPSKRLYALEQFLLARFASPLLQRNAPLRGVLAFALGQFSRATALSTVAAVAKSTGWSQRRFSQVFREQIGLSPKVWCRVQRFQRAVRQLRQDRNVPWPEMALDCGFYDQSHFANEFRAFSGIDPTTYTRAVRGPWANHIPAD